MRLAEWVRCVIVPNLPGFAIQAATAAPILYLANQADNLFVVVLLGFVSVAASLGFYLIVGLSREERSLLLATLGQAGGFLPGQRSPEAQSSPR